MTIEHASVRLVRKPWGRHDLQPWSQVPGDGEAVGEVWFERADPDAAAPALLLKLLFTSAPLSIQVHPDDEFARSMGLPRGKTEAWTILSALPGAKLAVGLKHLVSAADFKALIEDGSIVDLVEWRDAVPGEVVFVPAGTIHAIGAGLIVAEVQQNSDTTFRIHDYGSDRLLQIDQAIDVAITGPAAPSAMPRRLSPSRTLLVASPFFALERIELAPGSNWMIEAERETWLLVLEGEVRIGPTIAIVGEAIFIDREKPASKAGPDGLKALVAHEGDRSISHFLQSMDDRLAGRPVADVATLHIQDSPNAVSPTRSTEARP